MGLVLAIGLVSLSTGIGIWWPMVAAGEFSDTAERIPTYYLTSLAANFLGIALLRRWFVQRKDSRRQAAGMIEPNPEPRELCSDCKHGHLIPVSIALLPFWSELGYLLIVMGLWFSAGVAQHCFLPYGTGSIFIDRRNQELLYLVLMLLIGWIMRLRTRVLICDHCHCRSYPRPPNQVPPPEDEEDELPRRSVTPARAGAACRREDSNDTHADLRQSSVHDSETADVRRFELPWRAAAKAARARDAMNARLLRYTASTDSKE